MARPRVRRRWGRGRSHCQWRRKVKVKLADGKARTIQHMMVTTYWHPDGTPISAQQFLEMLYGHLPDFFKNEADVGLRPIHIRG